MITHYARKEILAAKIYGLFHINRYDHYAVIKCVNLG